jgi:glutamine amidotransferase
LILALKIDDRDLLGCALAALAPDVAIEGAQVSAVGAGFFDGGDLLIAKRPGHHGPVSLVADSRGARSEVFLLSAPAELGEAFAEERTAPVRYRQWLFADDGPALRERRASPGRAQALEDVPEFLRRQLPGNGPLDLAFLLFLDQLRQCGMLSSPTPEAEEVRPAFALAVQKLHVVESGASLIAASSRCLLVTRGLRPLYHRPVKGLVECARCGIASSDKSDRAQAHRQLKGLVATDSPVDPVGWTELRPRTILTVGRDLEARLSAWGDVQS